MNGVAPFPLSDHEDLLGPGALGGLARDLEERRHGEQKRAPESVS